MITEKDKVPSKNHGRHRLQIEMELNILCVRWYRYAEKQTKKGLVLRLKKVLRGESDGSPVCLPLRLWVFALILLGDVPAPSAET